MIPPRRLEASVTVPEKIGIRGQKRTELEGRGEWGLPQDKVKRGLLLDVIIRKRTT